MSIEDPKLPAVPLWHCQFQPIQAPLSSLTVGTKFEMDCSGDVAVNWNGRLEVMLPEKTPDYSLNILSVQKQEANSVQLIVTSYRPGHAKPEYVRIVTGDAGFEAQDLEWDVQSVVKQQQGQEPPKPFGPFGPFTVPMPIWVWILLACILTVIAGGIWTGIARARRRRRLREDLAKYSQVALSSSAQFHKELRQLSRKLVSEPDTKNVAEWIAILDQSLRIFLMREYRILTFASSRAQILTRFRRANRPYYDLFGEGLKKIFSEMDRFQAHAGQHKPVDFEQILHIARKWNDDIEKQKVKRQ